MVEVQLLMASYSRKMSGLLKLFKRTEPQTDKTELVYDLARSQGTDKPDLTAVANELFVEIQFVSLFFGIFCSFTS